jgi:hypothetical protein
VDPSLITALGIDGARIHTHWHGDVFVRLRAGELAEGPGPRWLSVAANGLCEQTCSDSGVVEAPGVVGGDFEQSSAADDDGQQSCPRDGDDLRGILMQVVQ